MLSLMEDGYLSSPASTPDAFFDEDKFLVKSIASKSNDPSRKIKWYHYNKLPVAIMSVSLCQIIFHVSSTLALNKLLRFEPTRRLELWRYITYMLVHDDWSHLALNVIIQCIFAALLEFNQGRFRVLAVYFLGGISGVLGAACLHPDLVVGASAGGYSLLLSNVADLMLNYETINYKLYRSISICTLVLFDILYDIVHVCTKKEPQVSWQAHFFGGISGIFLAKMKAVLFSLALVAMASALPQKEGGAYTNEAIRQAQQTFLIPKDAQIQKVQEGIEIGAYESIPGDQKINLFDILGDQFPPEVVNNLQGQIDQIGKH